MIMEAVGALTDAEPYPPPMEHWPTSTDDPDRYSSIFLEDWGHIGAFSASIANQVYIVGQVPFHYDDPYETQIVYTDELSYKPDSPYHVLLAGVPGDPIWLKGNHQEHLLRRAYGLSNDFTQDIDPKFDFLGEFFSEAKKYARQIRQAYTHRIEALQEDGAFEGITINEPSQRDFWAFASSIAPTKKASLVLMDNGNLRAVWKDENDSHLGIQFFGNPQAKKDSHLGIQFLGNGQVEYVIFRRRSNADHVSRVAGTDTLEGVKRQIRAFDLTSLVNA